VLRHESSFADLTLTSTPVTRGGVDFETRAELTIVAAGDESEPLVTALATMRRPRRATHEEVWAQLFVDGVFVDVVRAAEIDNGEPDPCFLARFVVPLLHLDGELHRARACFVTRLSRSSPKLDADESGIVPVHVDPGPEAIAEADFQAVRAPRARRA